MQQKNFSKELRRETSSYIEEEIRKLESSTVYNSDEIRSRISNCAEEVDNVIELAIEQFVSILDNAEGMVYAVEDRLQTEPSSDDIDEINDEVDDILDDFKEKFEVAIVPLIDELLRQFKKKLVSLQSDLRTCFDEILN